MLANRVVKRKSGSQRKRASVKVPHQKKEFIELIELRCEEGYLLGWEKEEGGRTIHLRYTREGKASRTDIKRRSKPSRIRSVSARERWSVNGERGRIVLQTSEGRKTSGEARKKKRGGRRWMWVM